MIKSSPISEDYLNHIPRRRSVVSLKKPTFEGKKIVKFWKRVKTRIFFEKIQKQSNVKEIVNGRIKSA